MRGLLIWLVGIFVLGSSACIWMDLEVGPMEGDGGDNQWEVGEGGDEEMDHCEPRTECEGACGTIDDGCGEVVECEPCECVDGVAPVGSCGLCGLGTLSCSAGETGPGVCENLEIPGATECGDLIFVDKLFGALQGAGNRTQPVSDLQVALARARENGAVALILAGDEEVVYEGPVILDERVSIIGGFDSEWNRREHRPQLYGPAPSPGSPEAGEDIVGISIVNVQEPILLANLEVLTADAEVEGGTNYGIQVLDSPDVYIQNVEVITGSGGDGTPGEDGAPGADGEDGGDATAMIHGFESDQGTDPQVGPRGRNPSCQEANGGNGGSGSHTTFSTLDRAWPGRDSASGMPGGSAGSSCALILPGQYSAVTAGGNGAHGETIHEKGSAGSAGISGGSISDGRWIPVGEGGDGGDGLTGHGGGGGGGAGMCTVDDYPFQIGSYGGGGAAGGCGGEGGEGGQPGGGSFGIFVHQSGVTLEDSVFNAGPGGSGGAGGFGGQGGAGGLGGVSSEAFYNLVLYFYADWELRGGYGGDGSDGSAGGHGGGGAGGVSFGGYCSQSTITTLDRVVFRAAPAAPGGASPGESGEDGLAVDFWECE